MNFISFDEVRRRIDGQSVAIVGSAPSCAENDPGFIDSHDLVIRINNYRIINKKNGTGTRTDIFYSFFGSSVRKTKEELKKDGVTLCLCKCPDSKPIESEWHEKNGKPLGVDFRYIYETRRDFWFCDTFIPGNEHFLEVFRVLDNHIPTTGFSCIQDVLKCNPGSIYITGFDFFSSGIHNVNEPWRPGRADDPIGHDPERELNWLRRNKDKFKTDAKLSVLLQG